MRANNGPSRYSSRRREYAVRVVLPSFGAWLAKLGVIAVFLAGYGITVTFHSDLCRSFCR